MMKFQIGGTIYTGQKNICNMYQLVSRFGVQPYVEVQSHVIPKLLNIFSLTEVYKRILYMNFWDTEKPRKKND